MLRYQICSTTSNCANYSRRLGVKRPSTDLAQANFPVLFNYYAQYRQDQSPQHQLMADHYIDVMARALYDFDGGKFDINLYKGLAWRGLLETDAYKTLSEEQKTELGNQIQALLSGRKKEGCDD